MHHALRLYGVNQELSIRLYIFAAKFTRVPVVGRIAKALMDWYAVTQHRAIILSREEAKKIIDAAVNVAVGDCKCRKVFKNCNAPIRADIVIGIGYDIFTEIRKEEYIPISKDEAKTIIDQCNEKGLIQSLLKCKGMVYSICNCCTCYCVPVRLNKVYKIREAWLRDKMVVDDLLRNMTL